MTLSSQPTAWIAAGIVLALVLSTIVRLQALREAEVALRQQRLASLRTWWLLGILLIAAIYAAPAGLVVLMAIASCLAIVEYHAITGLSGRPLLIGLTLLHYGLILTGNWSVFWVLLPVGGLALIILRDLHSHPPNGYLKRVGGLYWGLLMLAFAPSHALLPYHGPVLGDGPLGATGVILYLLLLTELNDIAQALVGRSMRHERRHRITPTLSPNKTWEGLIGGIVVTTILALLLAPLLTDFVTWSSPADTWLVPLAAGFVIAIAGFFGDITFSALKRDHGVKDSGHLLPGMGGVIDRIDSLTWSAPAFFFALSWIRSDVPIG